MSSKTYRRISNTTVRAKRMGYVICIIISLIIGSFFSCSVLAYCQRDTKARKLLVQSYPDLFSDEVVKPQAIASSYRERLADSLKCKKRLDKSTKPYDIRFRTLLEKLTEADDAVRKNHLMSHDYNEFLYEREHLLYVFYNTCCTLDEAIAGCDFQDEAHRKEWISAVSDARDKIVSENEEIISGIYDIAVNVKYELPSLEQFLNGRTDNCEKTIRSFKSTISLFEKYPRLAETPEASSETDDILRQLDKLSDETRWYQ